MKKSTEHRTQTGRVWIPGLLFLILMCSPAIAAEANTIDSGDTAWLLISTALVMLMTPGLAFFYGGMVRNKNVLGTIMHSFIILCIMSVVWVLWGYSLAFGPDIGGLVGSLKWFGLRGVGQEAAPFAPTVPHLVFMMFQGMFAIITPALITGAFAERIKFSALIVFTVLWATFVYSPICHWVWGGGWIGSKLGALDFAGGTVVHINSAIAAITAALVIGKRKGYLEEAIMPHNLPMTILGAALLWFGWFGFNAGSALATGLFASIGVNPGGANGLFSGNPSVLLRQLIASLSTILYSGIVTIVILKVVNWTVGLRVKDEEEVMGLDLSQHGETGYNL
jgi:Amt family ammonium transporter